LVIWGIGKISIQTLKQMLYTRDWLNKHMKSKDQLLLEQAYLRVCENESASILIPRRTEEERSKHYNRVFQQDIKAAQNIIDSYIENGSRGDLELSYSHVRSLPAGLKVGGSLFLDSSMIAGLPDGLEVKGNLYLNFTAKLKSLPRGLKVGKALVLGGSKVSSLPDDIQIGGYLDLCGSAVTSLPDGMQINGDLNIAGCNFSQLPDGLRVKGSLFAYNTNIDSLPADLRVGKKLDIMMTPLGRKYSTQELKDLLPGVKTIVS
jgi:hypothetical protein